ncbi:MAG: tryptophan synthase subunit alpha [Actinobacteria bacterium]|nr:tryptophan synthase subunit alpha [Actinomycetota bacterium]
MVRHRARPFGVNVSRPLDEVFTATRAAGRAALIGYLPAGFPTPQESVELITAMVHAGVDIIEVGLPYSDPLMDGPAIQEAVDLALKAGTTTDVVLDTVAQVTAAGATAVVMSYWNPIERYGVERFAARLADAGGVGVIAPDLTPEEAGPWIAATTGRGLDRVFLVAPSSTDTRITTVCSVTSGFVYAASTMGVTGARSEVSSAAPALVARTRRLTSLPIAVGLGVSTGAQAHEVAAYADGVIVGSAFVRRILDAVDHASALARVGDLAAELAVGVTR